MIKDLTLEALQAMVAFSAGFVVLAIVVIVGIIYCLLGRGGPSKHGSN